MSVATDLTLTLNGTRAEVRSTGERLFVAFSSLSDASHALRSLPDGSVDRLDELFQTTDLTLELRVRDRTVAVVGAQARPGVLSRGLDVAPVELRLGGVLGVVGRELAAALAPLERVVR